jgi:two-component system cell cycle sensor histidine kinase/response regulator CckA
MAKRAPPFRVSIDALSAPVAWLDVVEGKLWIRAASPALMQLFNAGSQPRKGDDFAANVVAFQPMQGNLAPALTALEQGIPEVVVEVSSVGSAISQRGRLALRMDGEYLIGSWHGRETDWRFEQIVQKSPDIIAIIDRQFRHVFVNDAIRANTGLDPAAFSGKDHRELGMTEEMVSYFQGVYRQVFESGQEGVKDFEFPSATGEPISYSSRVVPLIGPDGRCESLLSCARDVTERKRSEERRLEIERKLQETQRLESLGLLAGGVAHDFNNLLTAILGMTSVVQGRLEPSHAVQDLLSKIVLSCERAAGLCTQMLAYAQRQRVAAEAVAVAKLVEFTADLVRVSVSKNVELTLSLEGTEVATVEADRTQLQQLVLNLLLNAVEALPEQQGQVRVRVFCTRAEEVDFHKAVIAPLATSGVEQRLVAIEVSDTGVGIEAPTLSRIFEPFFSTKFAGRGLGLSATLGIVRAHGGGLSVESVPGKGSVFTLYLAESTQRETAQESSPAPPPRGTRVLVVDDEPHVREHPNQPANVFASRRR